MGHAWFQGRWKWPWGRPLVADHPEALRAGEESRVLPAFLAGLARLPAPSVLELGTRRTSPERGSLRRAWAPHAREFIGTDIAAGPDVDVVADVHRLSAAFGENRFDALISCSGFEHFQYPWIAVVELARVLKPGGLAFIQTHQTFPLHAYPCDYWRYSTDALRTLFSDQAGFRALDAEYVYRSRIVAACDPTLARQPSYLNVHLLAEKISHPPAAVLWQPR